VKILRSRKEVVMAKTGFKNIVYAGIILMSGFFLSGFREITITTDKGLFDIAVEVPDHLKVGRNTMELTVSSKRKGTNGKEKLKIEVAPWMPAHQHGSDEAPVIEERGKGRYLIEKLKFTMPGEWDVYIQVNDGEKEDTAIITVDVR
jgi:hypothetical protein